MVGKEPFLSNTQKPLPRVSEGVFVFGGLKGFNGIWGFKALYADWGNWEFREFPFLSLFALSALSKTDAPAAAQQSLSNKFFC